MTCLRLEEEVLISFLTSIFLFNMYFCPSKFDLFVISGLFLSTVSLVVKPEPEVKSQDPKDFDKIPVLGFDIVEGQSSI